MHNLSFIAKTVLEWAAALLVYLHTCSDHCDPPKIHMCLKLVFSRPEAFSTFCGPTQSTDGCPDIPSIHSDLAPAIQCSMLLTYSNSVTRSTAFSSFILSKLSTECVARIL